MFVKVLNTDYYFAKYTIEPPKQILHLMMKLLLASKNLQSGIDKGLSRENIALLSQYRNLIQVYAFYFTLKALVVLKILKLQSWLFSHIGKWLDYKDKVNLKTYDVAAW